MEVATDLQTHLRGILKSDDWPRLQAWLVEVGTHHGVGAKTWPSWKLASIGPGANERMLLAASGARAMRCLLALSGQAFEPRFWSDLDKPTRDHLASDLRRALSDLGAMIAAAELHQQHNPIDVPIRARAALARRDVVELVSLFLLKRPAEIEAATAFLAQDADLQPFVGDGAEKARSAMEDYSDIRDPGVSGAKEHL